MALHFFKEGENRCNITMRRCHTLCYLFPSVSSADSFPQASNGGFFCSGQKSLSFDNCSLLLNELNSPVPGIHFTTQKVLSLLAVISVLASSLAGDVKD